MGEIKSTLDLVMEKTRHMKMSRKERDAQIAETNRKKIAGLIQKYIDGLLRKDQFLKEFEKLDKIETQTNRQLLLQEGLARVEMEDTPGALLELLAFGCRIDVRPLSDVLKKYAAQKHALEVQCNDAIRRELAVKFNISGSAVAANLPVDPVFVRKLASLKDIFAQRLEKEKSNLPK